MHSVLYTGKSGLDAFQKKIETISNNIANTNTLGYKRLDQSFQELLRNEIGELGTPLSEELDKNNPTIGSGAKAGNVYRVYEQGILTPSSNPLELAIDGNGFFGIKDSNGQLLLSRTGNFSINEKGKLVDQNGNLVEVKKGKDLSDYSQDTIKINSQGEIVATDEDGEIDEIGQVICYDVLNKNMLYDAGNGYFKAKDEGELIDSTQKSKDNNFGSIHQGYAEMSNVDIGKELVDLMVAQRAYQFNSKSIQAADDMWQMTNNLKR